MRRTFLHLSIVTHVALLGVLGCSSSTTTPSDPGTKPDAASGVDATPDGGGLSQCTTAKALGASVDSVATDGEVTPPAGGALADGTYVLTGARVYGSSLADGAKVNTIGSVTVVISAGATKYEQIKGGPEGGQGTGALQLAGTSLTFTETCASPAAASGAPEVYGYTASAGTLTTTLKDDIATVEFEFAKK